MEGQSARVEYAAPERDRDHPELISQRPVRGDRWGGWRLPCSPLDSPMTCHFCWGVSTFLVVLALLEIFHV